MSTSVNEALEILEDVLGPAAINQWFPPGGELQYLRYMKRMLILASEAVDKALQLEGVTNDGDVGIEESIGA